MDTPAYLFPGIPEWLIILPILIRLYTSVIPSNPENKGPEVSCPTDMSPTTIFSLVHGGPSHSRVSSGVGGCTRGGGDWWVPGGYTGVLPGTLPGPHISHILASEAYLRPNEGNSQVYDEVPQDGSRIDQELTQN